MPPTPATATCEELLVSVFPSIFESGASGVGTRTVVKQRERVQTNTTWVRRYSNGLCRTGVYFVGVPNSEYGTCTPGT